VFWPNVPRFGTHGHGKGGFWGRVSRLIERRPRRVWLSTAVLLGFLALGLTDLHSGQIPIAQSFSGTPAAVTAQAQVDAHYPQSGTEPVQVLAAASADAQVKTILYGTASLAASAPGGYRVVALGSRNLYTVSMGRRPTASPRWPR
jgi:RND superfamily putative drug exporter